jgi:repressor LexA
VWVPRILGAVEAGWPSPAEEEIIDIISIDEWLIQDKEASFMLKVTGDSMIEAGIMPGDLVLISRGKQPRTGDVVVAEVDRDWTIKIFEKRGREVRLLPANPRYVPIVPAEELRIAGVVTACIRKY